MVQTFGIHLYILLPESKWSQMIKHTSAYHTIFALKNRYDLVWEENQAKQITYKHFISTVLFTISQHGIQLEKCKDDVWSMRE